jgi:hypothetical protein
MRRKNCVRLVGCVFIIVVVVVMIAQPSHFGEGARSGLCRAQA